MRKLLLFVLIAGAISMAVVALRLPDAEAAAGPCGTSHDAVDSEEAQFLSLLQQWRDQNLPNSSPLQLSGPLNAAAAWFAEYQVSKGGGGGHYDNYGRNWAQRAADCGYPEFYALRATGEGVYAVAASAPPNVGPSQAVVGITYPTSGAAMWVPASGNYPPVKCVGVAVKRNAAGTVVAWVAVLAQYPSSQSCPEAATGGGGSTVTATVTPGTPTPSPTPTSTPTKTPSPTPVTYHAFAPLVSTDESR